MTMKNFCDRCGKEISNRFIRPKTRMQVMLENPHNQPYVQLEFCELCYMEFIDKLGEFCGGDILKGQIR